MIIASAVVVLLLLGGGILWFVGRAQSGTNEPTGIAGVPTNAVAYINSSTPLPTTLALAGPKDPLGSLLFAPDTQGWSSALLSAQQALDEGRYGAAVSQFSALVGSTSVDEGRNALWGLANAYRQSGQSDLAVRTYTLLAQLDDPRAPRAYADLASIYSQTGRDTLAVEAYKGYLKRAGPAAHALMIMEAGLMGATQDAEDVYKAVLADNPADVDKRDALLAWADVKSRRGDHKGALALYDQLAALETVDPRPLLDNYSTPPYVLAAKEAKSAGDKAGAQSRLLAYLNGNCGSSSAARPCPAYVYGQYAALTTLLDMNASAVVSGTVPAMQAAQLAYDAGDYAKAISFLNTARQQTPNSPQLAAVNLLTGKTYETTGDDDAAYNWYTQTVQSFPTSPQAAEAIRRAGDALRDQSQWDNAMSVYAQAVQSYTVGVETMEARLNSGVLAYRLGDNGTALTLLQGATAMGTVSSTLEAQAYFWLGKVQKSGGNAAWKTTLGKVAALDPGSYYSFRAVALLDGEGAQGPLITSLKSSNVTADKLGVSYDSEGADRAALLSWAITLTTTKGSPLATPATADGIQSPLKDDPELQRAVALLNMGYDTAAFTAFRVLAERLSMRGDAPSLAQLILYLRYHAGTNTAMRVSEQLAAMWQGDPTKLPPLLLKTLYPTPYSSLVMQEAGARDLDPLPLYALMRQESQFKAGASSGAGALGLTQVIPSTGASIADQLGDTGFTADNLYLPYVSIRYGAYYLATNLPSFDRKMLPALAAYNAGPGSASAWLAGSALVDPDLYIERVDLFETADYLSKVYTNYGFYKMLYAP